MSAALFAVRQPCGDPATILDKETLHTVPASMALRAESNVADTKSRVELTLTAGSTAAETSSFGSGETMECRRDGVSIEIESLF